MHIHKTGEDDPLLFFIGKATQMRMNCILIKGRVQFCKHFSVFTLYISILFCYTDNM